MSIEQMVDVVDRALSEGKTVEISAGCFDKWTEILDMRIVGDQLVHVQVDAPVKPDVFISVGQIRAVRVTG